jgi:phosphoglycerate kinase
VAIAADTVGPSARSVAPALAPGDVLMLENLRFNPGETSKDDSVRRAFADQLASLAELYVDDASGTVHVGMPASAMSRHGFRTPPAT